MSTWTSKVSLLVAGGLLAACGAGLSVTRNAPVQVQLPDGMVVEGARGWCVDRATSKAREGGAVVVLGSCAAIAGNALLPSPGVAGVVTISVEDETGSPASLSDVAAFLATDQGRALLARDGRPASVNLLEIAAEDDALFLHALDTSGGPLNTGADYWRAVFDIDGRFVSVSLMPNTPEQVSRAQSIATLDAQIDRLKAANAR
ncbi:MAG: hypothetical protein KJO30_12420 [Boseongicola sp.]|nr:hypothetical protein [Boseongicola sp.]